MTPISNIFKGFSNDFMDFSTDFMVLYSRPAIFRAIFTSALGAPGTNS